MAVLVLGLTTESIECLMSGAPAATQPSYLTAYADNDGIAFTEGKKDGALSGVTPVAIVSAPAASTRRIVKNIVIYNEDTASVTITVRLNTNGTFRRLFTKTIASLGTYEWAGTDAISSLGFTPENVANKENTTLDTSTTKYPTNRLTKEYADTKTPETATTIGALIGGAGDATPNDTDFVATSLTAGGILKKITWTNVKAFLKTYFDTLYNLYVHPNHSGDVTSVADGAQTIATDAVTYAKIQNVSATDKVLGRVTAGAGDVEEIACTAAGRALLDDADAAAQRTTLSLNNVDNTSDATKNAATVTLTNKRITGRVGTVASSATPTPDGDANDIFTVTALAVAATFAAPTGTPTNGQKLIIRIKDDATARALAWNAIYRAGTDVALPTTTVVSKTMYCGFIYNSADTKWDLVASVNNI